MRASSGLLPATSADCWLPAENRPQSRIVVERGGFEPPKREARQIYSLLPLTTRPPLHGWRSARAAGIFMLEPKRGLEPLTYRLQIGCAASCATWAGSDESENGSQHKNDPPQRIKLQVWNAYPSLARKAAFRASRRTPSGECFFQSGSECIDEQVDIFAVDGERRPKQQRVVHRPAAGCVQKHTPP